MRVLRHGNLVFDNRWWGRAMPSCHFVHLILLLSGQKVPKSGPFKNEGIHEMGASIFSGRKLKLCVSSELGSIEAVGIGEILAATRSKLR
jgi:hypothetical protein